MKLLSVALSCLLPFAAFAEDEPSFAKLRFEDSYEYLETMNTPAALPDLVKRIPLPLTNSYLSLGGEARLRYEYQKNPTWGEEPQDRRGAFLQRYLLHINIELGEHVRAFAELRSALEDGRRASASPVEEGELGVQQAFLELRGHSSGAGLSASIRGGRQEIRLGTERMVSVREGTNVRRRFDGIRADVSGKRFQATAIAAYVTENRTGVFNDGANEDAAFWGLYVVFESPFDVPTNVDLYYLGSRNNKARFVQGLARDLRHSVGVRLHGERRGIDWNWESIVQWGTFGSADVLAWTIASETGYRFDSALFSPRVFLSANIASGDKNPNDSDLQTFRPLFPLGNYFSHTALLGPRNFWNLHPGARLDLTDSVVLGVDANFYWRLETSDGIYGPAGNIIRDGAGTNSRYVGTGLSGSLEWDVNRFLFLGIIYTHGFPSSFVERTGPSQDIDFVELTARVRF